MLDGSARVQRSQKRVWEDLALGKKVNDNDLIETFFQSRLVLQFGAGNMIIMGSNSRLLINIREESVARSKQNILNITLFGGGVLVKVTSGARVFVYTANAVGSLDSGALSTVVEEKTGETGFQALEGAVAVRNVIQQTSMPLTAGQTTLVFPGRAPTPALYITTRHVAVLKHFFGDEYIAGQLIRSGITPSQEKPSDLPRRSFAENLIEKKQAQQQADDAVYKPPISRNKVFGAVLALQQQEAPGVEVIMRPQQIFKTIGSLGIGTQIAVSNGAAYPILWLRPSLHFPWAAFGINVIAARDFRGFGMPQFSSSLYDLCSLIDFADLSLSIDKFSLLSVHAGSLDELSMANGLVVDRLRTVNAYSLIHPLCLSLKAVWQWLKFDAFAVDLLSFTAGGGHLLATTPVGVFGAGCYFDRNPRWFIGAIPASRFIDFPDSFSSTATDTTTLTYELNVGIDIAQYYNASAIVWAEFAQKLAEGKNEGYLVHAPRVCFSVHNFSLSAGLLLEAGNLMAGSFNAAHPNLRFWTDAKGYIQPAPWLTPDRRAWGATLSCQAAVKGLTIDARGRYDFLTHNAIRFQAEHAGHARDFFSRIDGLKDTLLSLTYDFSLSVALNDSLWKRIKFARLYARQVQGRLYPSSFTIAGWRGFEAGGDVVSVPFVFNLALEAGARLIAIDLSEPGAFRALGVKDLLPDIYVGLRWGFW